MAHKRVEKKGKTLLKAYLTFKTRPFLIRKLHRGRVHASLIHTLCNELMNYEFSGGNNGFVCWANGSNDSYYKWKKRLAHLESAVMEMSGNFVQAKGFQRHCVKRNPFTIRTYSNYKNNNNQDIDSHYGAPVLSFSLCPISAIRALEKGLVSIRPTMVLET